MGMGGGQPGQGGMKLDPEMVKVRWKKMDRDGDGKVSKEEYTGDFEFDRLDSDKDGFLTDTDAAKLAEAMGPGGMGGKGPGGAPGGKPPAPPSPEEIAKRFTEMDRDQNGKVEAAEMPEMLRERMLRADTDGDGALTKDEFAEGMKKAQRGPGGKGGPGGGKGPGAPGGPGGKASEGPQAPGLEILKRFDHDHDGKVERDQFPGSDEKFAQLDTDKDGVLTEKDFPAAPAKPAPDGGGAGTGLIARCDKDGDGRLSRAEFQGTNDEWRALDTNQDGWVDAAEAGAVKPPAAK
jgi:Ca2+-binding EF-hand superfamily protein